MNVRSQQAHCPLVVFRGPRGDGSPTLFVVDDALLLGASSLCSLVEEFLERFGACHGRVGAASLAAGGAVKRDGNENEGTGEQEVKH